YFAREEIHKELEIIIEKTKKSYEPPTKHLIYEVADYHRPVSFFNIDQYIREHRIGLKSPCPTLVEGQLILSLISLPAGDRHRVSYALGKLITFRLTRETVNTAWYHGYFCLKGL